MPGSRGCRRLAGEQLAGLRLEPVGDVGGQRHPSIPDGIVLYAQPGGLPEQALEQLITQARELDMDEVRAALADRSDAGKAAGA